MAPAQIAYQLTMRRSGICDTQAVVLPGALASHITPALSGKTLSIQGFSHTVRHSGHAFVPSKLPADVISS